MSPSAGDPIAFWNNLRDDFDDPELREAYKRAVRESRGDADSGADILARVPKPIMVMRSLRVPAALWNQAKTIADERDENISDVIREALERYVKRNRK